MRLRATILTMALFVGPSLLVTDAPAQTSTTGTIEGIVSDQNGAIVPAVKVTVSSPNLISAQSVTTNVTGWFRILNLPPGKYVVSAEAADGFDQASTSVEVSLSKTTIVPIRLEPVGARATVTVIGRSGAVVDTTSNTGGANISTEQFSDFVTQRTVQSIYSIAPSVTRSGLSDASGRDRDPGVAGSSGLENRYIMDGLNTTDPSFGGSGANLPFEFIQEVEIKPGAYGAEYGLSTGGIFNVLTKSGGNQFHGDAFAYLATQGMVRATRNFPLRGSAPDGFSELDAGFDGGGAIKRNKLWFFGAINPQRRQNFYFTQTLRQQVSNKVTTPFYAAKLTYAPTEHNTVTFSTFADFTNISGFLVNNFAADTLAAGGTVSGFGAGPDSFSGEAKQGGDNYTVRLNSTLRSNWIGEFAFGIHRQRNNLNAPENQSQLDTVTDNFAIVRNGAVLPVVDTNVDFAGATGFLAFVDGRGGSLDRDYTRQGFLLRKTDQSRNRLETEARLQNVFNRHTLKYGFEFSQNRIKLDSEDTGPERNFGGVRYDGYNVSNRFGVCTVQTDTVACPAGALTSRVNALIAAGQAPNGILNAVTNTGLTSSQLSTNPFLIRSSTIVSTLFDSTGGHFITTSVESFYGQDDFRITRDIQLSFGARWDYQQLKDYQSTYLELNSFKNSLQPRLGLIWDFTGKAKGKFLVNYARFLEAPIPTMFLFAAPQVHLFWLLTILSIMVNMQVMKSRAASKRVSKGSGSPGMNRSEANRQGQASYTATEAKHEFGRVLEQAIHGTTVVITKHDAPRAVLISMDEFKALQDGPQLKLNTLTEQFDDLLNRMQTPQARQGMSSTFSSSPKRLGKAAVASARKRG